jgi:hypothetical protein
VAAPLLAPLPAPLPAPAQAPLVDARVAAFLANEAGAPITLAGSPAPTGTGGPLSAVTNLPTGGPVSALTSSFPSAPTLTPAPNTDPPVVARGASPIGGPRVEQVVASAMVGAMGSLWRLGGQVAGVVEQRLAGLLAKGGPDAPAGEAPPPAPAARGPAAASHAADESSTVPAQDQPRRTNATLTVVMAVTVLVLQRVQARRGTALLGKRWRKSRPVPQDQPPEPTA